MEKSKNEQRVSKRFIDRTYFNKDKFFFIIDKSSGQRREFVVDEHGGWFDERGNYFDKDARKQAHAPERKAHTPNPKRFQGNYFILNDKSGFYLPVSANYPKFIYTFDDFGGWFDEYGNYYDKDTNPTAPPQKQQKKKNRATEQDSDVYVKKSTVSSSVTSAPQQQQASSSQREGDSEQYRKKNNFDTPNNAKRTQARASTPEGKKRNDDRNQSRTEQSQNNAQKAKNQAQGDSQPKEAAPKQTRQRRNSEEDAYAKETPEQKIQQERIFQDQARRYIQRQSKSVHALTSARVDVNTFLEGTFERTQKKLRQQRLLTNAQISSLQDFTSVQADILSTLSAEQAGNLLHQLLRDQRIVNKTDQQIQNFLRDVESRDKVTLIAQIIANTSQKNVEDKVFDLTKSLLFNRELNGAADAQRNVHTLSLIVVSAPHAAAADNILKDQYSTIDDLENKLKTFVAVVQFRNQPQQDRANAPRSVVFADEADSQRAIKRFLNVEKELRDQNRKLEDRILALQREIAGKAKQSNY